jgi:hypothetical protein
MIKKEAKRECKLQIENWKLEAGKKKPGCLASLIGAKHALGSPICMLQFSICSLQSEARI